MRQEVFRLNLRRHDYDMRTALVVESRIYDVCLQYTMRDQWGDPDRLAEYIDRLIGGTLRAWDAGRVRPDDGREMARALMPHWERQIHLFMERMEYRDRWSEAARYMRDGRWPEPNRMWFNEWGDFVSPPEDPKAKDKARQLLMRQLDDGQLKSFKKDGTFRVTAKDGKVYTISTARSFNVKAEDGTRYCGQLADTPIEDQMLAQKLLLEHEPEKFLKNANVSSPMTIDQHYQNQMMDMAVMRPGSFVRVRNY